MIFIYKTTLGLLFCTTLVFNSERVSYFFPEYKFYFTPDSCTEQKVLTIGGYKLLNLRMMKDCNEIELKCVRSKDSTLIESGIYQKTDSVNISRSVYRDIDTQEEHIVIRKKYILRRAGIWKFYNREGKILREVNYK